MTDLIPQQHGGAINPPWRKGDGVSKGASAKGVSMKALRKKAREMYQAVSEEVTRKHIELIRSDDPRVATVNIQEYFNRFWGKVGDTGFAHDEAQNSLDLSHLSPEKQQRAMVLLMELQALLGEGKDGE